jgi:hypothetical protein
MPIKISTVAKKFHGPRACNGALIKRKTVCFIRNSRRRTTKRIEKRNDESAFNFCVRENL